MNRYICIHGHFYQPPRENPWLEFTELQDSAYPYHDWNDRINAECYAANMLSRILDGEDRITQIVNNYARISFNFGPTLLSWMETNAPDICQGILEADRESQLNFSGHGSALAQPYNHMIMPLANDRDKRTQVIWGIGDFQRRFGRDPEGMWLPETAVDLATLEVLADLGIAFTILAPHQARRVRPSPESEWQDTKGGSIDPTMAYRLHLPSGRAMALFFYDSPIARAVAFEGLLGSGEQLALRLSGAFSDDRAWPQLVHVATDGETYGHHHRNGDMALAYALDYIESNRLARVTNYGEYLEKHPPEYEVEIVENTSWSCVHGVERWRSDCGCNTGGHPGWNQAWRAPLRETLDWLRDTLSPMYEKYGSKLLADPWTARDEYISVILDRSPENVEHFLSTHAVEGLDETGKVQVLKLMELQRHAMLMYTSCGWFFDELSGIETVQIIRYAGRSVQLAQDLFGDEVEDRFLERLERAKSNIRKHHDGRRIYEEMAKPAMVDLSWVAAHYAISSLFEEYGDEPKIHCYSVDVEERHSLEAGRATLAVGRVGITSDVTHESAPFSFGVLHLGDHNLSASVREYRDADSFQAMVSDISQAFSTAEFPETIRRLDKHLGTSTYSVRYLFRDEQRRILELILQSTLNEVEAAYRQVYDLHYPLMLFLTDLGNPLPRAFQGVAEFILNTDLSREFCSDALDVERIDWLLKDAGVWGIELDAEGLSYILKCNLERMIDEFATDTPDPSLLQELIVAVGVAQSVPFEVNMWKVQNIYWALLQTAYPDFKARAERGDKEAEEWVKDFTNLGAHLSIRMG